MEYITPADLKSVENYADDLFSDVGVDVEFTRHFLDRVNDLRNKEDITPDELKDLYLKAYNKYANTISKLHPGEERVLTDPQSNINIPFAMNWDGRSPDVDLVNKTVMRKKDFKSYTPKLRLEDLDIDTQGYIVDAILNEEFDPFDHDYVDTGSLEGVMDDCILSINIEGNKKLRHPYFSLPAGYSCPFAHQCLSKADKGGKEIGDTGKKIEDFGEFRCYAASQEVQYKNLRKSRWRNFDLLKGKSSDEMAEIINNSIKYHLPHGTHVFRIHESGDFFNQAYFDAWLKVAKERPDIIFYAYTKSLKYWINRLNEIPENFILNASKGGKNDDLIDKYGLKYVEVVYSPEEAAQKHLKIDLDDSLAWKQKEPFAQLLHGQQAAGSKAGIASRKNRAIMDKIKAQKGLNEGIDEDTIEKMESFGITERDIDSLGYIKLFHGGLELPEKLNAGEIFFLTNDYNTAEMYANIRGQQSEAQGEVFIIKVKPEDVSWNTGSGEIEFDSGGDIVDLGDGTYKLYPFQNENIDVPINIGDTVLGGKFKNKKIVVKDIDKNEKGDITINDKPLLKVRITKK